jgi:antagonist of KipI
VSIEVVKAGLFDTVQDEGRFGYQHLGINPSGVMDSWAMRIANLLVGNPPEEAVVEMTFPAASFRFHQPALIALAGADFCPLLNGHKISMWQPYFVGPGTLLQFSRRHSGMFCYLAVHKGFKVNTWLGSKSTHVPAAQGGVQGRNLITGDQLLLNEEIKSITDTQPLPFRAAVGPFYLSHPVGCLPGPEKEQLPAGTEGRFAGEKFYIHPHSNRMGYRLAAVSPLPAHDANMYSEAVTFGTIQLLPDGALMALMADHQTTGGYPRLAVIARAWWSAFVQLQPGEATAFKWITRQEAETLFVQQVLTFRQLAVSCTYKLKKWLDEKH